MKTIRFLTMLTLAASMLIACGKENDNDGGIDNTTTTELQGALPGIFTVGEGKQIVFSQGNLQYRASDDTWRFAENQYDYIGEDNWDISATNSGWIDLFCWGTSGWDGRMF